MARLFVLALDGLQAAWLGPYGNTWIPTPAWNRLAVESLILDRYWLNTTELCELYRQWFHGHRRQDDLTTMLHAAGHNLTLLTDDASVADFAPLLNCAERIVLPTLSPERPAEDWTETATARFFVEAGELLQTQSDNSVTWLHCGAIGSVWDAPRALREAFVDEEDPPPNESTKPPSYHTAPDVDPDELLPLRVNAAAQTTVADECLGLLLELIDNAPLADQTWLVVLTGRGYPLAEHGQFGWSTGALLPELLRGGAFIRAPRGQQGNRRSPWLAQPSDLPATLCALLNVQTPDNVNVGMNWLHAGYAQPPASWPTAIQLTGRDQIGLITEQWWYTQDKNLNPQQITDRNTNLTTSGRPAVELYLQPDDYFCVNNIADRCPRHATACAEWLATCNTSDHTPPLPAVLSEVID